LGPAGFGELTTIGLPLDDQSQLFLCRGRNKPVAIHPRNRSSIHRRAGWGRPHRLPFGRCIHFLRPSPRTQKVRSIGKKRLRSPSETRSNPKGRSGEPQIADRSCFLRWAAVYMSTRKGASMSLVEICSTGGEHTIRCRPMFSTIIVAAVPPPGPKWKVEWRFHRLVMPSPGWVSVRMCGGRHTAPPPGCGACSRSNEQRER